MDSIPFFKIKIDCNFSTSGINGLCYYKFDEACKALDLECKKVLSYYLERGWTVLTDYSRVDRFPSGNDYIRKIAINDSNGYPIILSFDVIHKRLPIL